MTDLWFLLFLTNPSITLTMHGFGPCAANAVAITSKIKGATVACISPDLDNDGNPQGPFFFTNGVMEPHPK